MSGLSHAVLPYAGMEQFMDGALPFISAGIAAGDAVLAVTSAETIEALTARLGGDADGLTFAEHGAWYSHPARTLARCVAQADGLAAQGRRLRLVAEPVWQGRTSLEVAEWQRVEAIVNVAFAGTGATILCPYDVELLPRAILDGARRSHPMLVRGGRWRHNEGYMDPWSYTASIDRLPLSPPPDSAEAWRIDAADLYWLRAFIRECGAAAMLAGWELQCLLMAVTEVATNALRYGEPPVVLRLWTEELVETETAAETAAETATAELVCEISNGGYWRPAPGHGLVPPAPTAPSRFGLWAVRLLCSIVQVRTGQYGTTIRLRLPLPPGSGLPVAAQTA